MEVCRGVWGWVTQAYVRVSGEALGADRVDTATARKNRYEKHAYTKSEQETQFRAERRNPTRS